MGMRSWFGYDSKTNSEGELRLYLDTLPFSATEAENAWLVRIVYEKRQIIKRLILMFLLLNC
jgi:hypothetical protein